MSTTTPILDLELDPEKPPSRGVSAWLRPLSYAVLGGVIGITLPDLIAFLESNIPAFIPALFFAIAIHELGHLAAAMTAGMKPGGLAICGLAFMRSGDRWVFRFHPRWIVGGFARPLPETGQFDRWRFAWMVAGGPLTNIAACIACLLISRMSGDPGTPWVKVLFWANMLCLTSLWPSSCGVNKSDGAHLWLLLFIPNGLVPGWR